MIKKNKEYIVTIEGYNSEGAGVARIDGRAVFIPNTLKGEVWHIKILKVTAGAIYGKALEIYKASQHRVKPECRYFSACGGCSGPQAYTTVPSRRISSSLSSVISPGHDPGGTFTTMLFASLISAVSPGSSF